VLAHGPFDILVTNAGGPPPGMWSDWSREDFIKALDANMLTPIALMQAVLPGMMAQGLGRVVNITSSRSSRRWRCWACRTRPAPG
jgi:3-oxoacyl-[acyl-carrier protein] reductase